MRFWLVIIAMTVASVFLWFEHPAILSAIDLALLALLFA